MSEVFNSQLRKFFGASRGAYSLITPNEYEKSQVTFVGPEQELAESFFGKRLEGHNGSTKDIVKLGLDPEFEFRIHPTGEIKKLTVSYKKNKPGELRFYARRPVFKPNPGEFWCIFERDGEIWLGSFSEWMLHAINDGTISGKTRDDLIEDEVDSYQVYINNKNPEKKPITSMKWMRNPLVAEKAIAHYGYFCEIHPEYPTFKFKNTNLNFVEAHHLIPMKLQGKFDGISLDQVDNICILNPTVHRMLHYADFKFIERDLEKLIKLKNSAIKRIGLNRYDLLEIYQ